MHYFYGYVLGSITSGKIRVLMRSLTNPQIVLITFSDLLGINHNNLAERTLRLAVTKRKVSGGSRSMPQFQHTANLLTVVQTCRSQGRSVIQFFQQAIKAMVNPAVQSPSLIPQVST